jgi:hypothetical protein
MRAKSRANLSSKRIYTCFGRLVKVTTKKWRLSDPPKGGKVSLRLAFQHYDSLNDLGLALDGLYDFAFQLLADMRRLRDRNEPPSLQQVRQWTQLTTGVLDAKRMIGRIQLGILNDNPAQAETDSDEQELIVIPSLAPAEARHQTAIP